MGNKDVIEGHWGSLNEIRSPYDEEIHNEDG